MSSTSPPSSKSYSFNPWTNHITFLKSDGDIRRWPGNTTHIVTDGQINYMEESREDKKRHWRKAIGTTLACQLKHSDSSSNTWELADFPHGYKLYTHKNGSLANYRTDIYLYGGPYVFRSPNEFIPHALWLCEGMKCLSTGKPDCLCEYCTPTGKRRRAFPTEQGQARPAKRARVTPYKGPGIGRGTRRSQKRAEAPLLPFEPKWEGGGPRPGTSTKAETGTKVEQ